MCGSRWTYAGWKEKRLEEESVQRQREDIVTPGAKTVGDPSPLWYDLNSFGYEGRLHLLNVKSSSTVLNDAGVDTLIPALALSRSAFTARQSPY